MGFSQAAFSPQCREGGGGTGTNGCRCRDFVSLRCSAVNVFYPRRRAGRAGQLEGAYFPGKFVHFVPVNPVPCLSLVTNPPDHPVGKGPPCDRRDFGSTPPRRAPDTLSARPGARPSQALAGPRGPCRARRSTTAGSTCENFAGKTNCGRMGKRVR